jgi:hypothetical protein
MKADPARLLDNPGSDLDVLLLESGLDEEPPARIADRTLVALGVASAAGAGAGAVGAAAASIKAGGTLGWWAGPWALVAKVGIGVAVVGGVVGGGYAVMAPPPGAGSAAPPAVIVEQAGQPSPSTRAEAAALPGSENTGASEASQSEKTGAQAADPVAANEKGAEPDAAAKVAAPAKGADAAKPAKPADAEKASAAMPAGAKAAESGSTLAQERQLIESARASLRNGDKAGAVAILDTYPSRFPKGQLKNEVAGMRQAIVASP